MDAESVETSLSKSEGSARSPNQFSMVNNAYVKQSTTTYWNNEQHNTRLNNQNKNRPTTEIFKLEVKTEHKKEGNNKQSTENKKPTP